MSVVIIPGLKRTVDCPATVYLPGDDGAHVAHAYTVQFRRVTTAQRDELQRCFVTGEMPKQKELLDVLASAPTGEPATEGTTPTAPRRFGQRDLIDAVVVGWAGMFDAQGNAVAYSAKERVATDDAYPGLEQSMATAWFDHAFINQREAAAKNSKPPSGTTTA